MPRYINANSKGTSPRVWGQVSFVHKAQRLYRIIPTRMGTRPPCIPRRKNPRDHPHAYGDKRVRNSDSFALLGSSPRVWGQVVNRQRVLIKLRIIPTRMGTRIRIGITMIIMKDHPHAYGDKTKEIKENSGFAKSTA